MTPSPSDEAVEYANMEIIQEIIAQRKENSTLPSAEGFDSGRWKSYGLLSLSP